MEGVADELRARHRDELVRLWSWALQRDSLGRTWAQPGAKSHL